MMLDQSCYASEALERRRDSQRKKIDFDDALNLTERDKLLIENAYRRGFYQGWFKCLELVDRGFVSHKLEKFLYGPLFTWRYKKHGGQFEIAPELKSKGVA